MQRERRAKKNSNTWTCEKCSIIIETGAIKRHKCPENLNQFDEGQSFARTDIQFEHSFSNAVAHMLHDDIGNGVRQDNFLLHLGYEYFEKYRNSKKLHDTEERCRTFMRYLHRLRTKVVGNNPKYSIEDMIKSENVSRIIETLKKESPANIIHFCNCLMRAAELSLTVMADKKDKHGNDEVDYFMQSFKQRSRSIKRDAEMALNERKNTTNRAPGSQAANENIKSLVDSIRMTLESGRHSTRKEFRNLQNSFLSYLTLTNGKRGGEAKRMSVVQAQMGLEDHYTKTISKKITQKEKQKVTSQTYIHVDSKIRGRTVSVNYNKKYDFVMKIMLNKNVRTKHGIHPVNPFVFGSSRGDGCINSQHAMQAVKKAAGLPGDTVLKATAVRHAFADAGAEDSDIDEDQLCLNLDHEKGIHRGTYRSINAAKAILTNLKIQENMGIAEPDGMYYILYDSIVDKMFSTRSR